MAKQMYQGYRYQKQGNERATKKSPSFKNRNKIRKQFKVFERNEGVSKCLKLEIARKSFGDF